MWHQGTQKKCAARQAPAPVRRRRRVSGQHAGLGQTPTPCTQACNTNTLGVGFLGAGDIGTSMRNRHHSCHRHQLPHVQPAGCRWAGASPVSLSPAVAQPKFHRCLQERSGRMRCGGPQAAASAPPAGPPGQCRHSGGGCVRRPPQSPSLEHVCAAGCPFQSCKQAHVRASSTRWPCWKGSCAGTEAHRQHETGRRRM